MFHLATPPALGAFRGAAVLALVCLPSWSAAENAPPAALIEALQEGGYVLYIRHAMTESDYADQITADPDNCATQRVLSEAGWAQARAIGGAIKALDIPVADVVSSSYCRAWQSADLAFGQYRKDAALNFAKAESYSDAQIAQMRSGVAPYFETAPEAGNLVIVGHDDPFEATTGIYPEPQGVAYVVRPGPDGFAVMGRIDPDDWPGMRQR